MTGKDPNGTIWSGQSWYDSQYANYGFTRGTTVSTTQKALVCFENHVAVIEDYTEDGKWIISEGGSGYAGSTYDYCRIERFNTINDYLNQVTSQYAFKGYVYLGVSFPPKDNEKPAISNVSVSNVSISGYTVTCSVKDNRGVARVAFPTWTE